MARTQIQGDQVKDESITEDDIKDGSIKAAELHIEAITGQALHTGEPDEANDMLLLYDQSTNSLKKMPLSDVAGPGGGGESLSFVTGHVDLTVSNKPVNWVNASSISNSDGIKSWFIVPKATTIDKVIVSVRGNNFSTANDGNVTLNIYKNQPNFDTTILSQTVGADDFSEKVSNMRNGNTDCNQKIFAGLNQSVAEGDLIHMKVGKSAGSDKEALVTVVFSTTGGSSSANKSAFIGRASAIPAAGGSGWAFSFGDGQGNTADASGAYNRDTMVIAPHDGEIKDLIMTVHQAGFSASTYGNITLAVYKNGVQFDAAAKLIDLTTSADTFSAKQRTLDGGQSFTTFANQKNFADLFGDNVHAVSKGDVIQVVVHNSTASSQSSLDITLGLVIEET